MSVEELLKPRYKVEGPYPGSRYKVGDMVESLGENRFDLYKDGVTYYNEPELKKYPQLFRLMNWWEDRRPEDMPEYVRIVKTTASGLPCHSIHKVDKYLKRSCYVKYGEFFSFNLSCFNTEPATIADYETYLTTNKLNP